MKYLRINMVLVVLIVLLPMCEEIEEIDVDSEIVKEMEKLQIPSVAACLLDTNGIVWTGLYGHANVEHDIELTDETIYSLQSISKLILAVCTMQLWERGLIDLEQDINQYLSIEINNPYYPDRKITPAMLLTHSSGLAWPADEDPIPDFHHFYMFEDPPLIKDWLPEYIVPGGGSYRESVWKDFAPGEKYLYSNIGTSLLALVLEEITGLDYRDYCRDNILDPLEMWNSGFSLNNLVWENLVTPYYHDNSPMYFFTSRHYPAGFLNCSLTDFAKFSQACLNRGRYKEKRILKESTMDKMLELQNENTGVAYLWHHFLGGYIGHKGGGTGFSTWSEWHMENGSALFIFSSKENEAIDPGGRIYDLVKYKQRLLESL